MKKYSIKDLQKKIKEREISIANEKEKICTHYSLFKKNINLSTFVWSGASGFLIGQALRKRRKNNGIKNTNDQTASRKIKFPLNLLSNYLLLFKYFNTYLTKQKNSPPPSNSRSI